MTEWFQETQDDGRTEKLSSSHSFKDEDTAEVCLAINKNCIVYFVGIKLRDICKHPLSLAIIQKIFKTTLIASKYIT